MAGGQRGKSKPLEARIFAATSYVTTGFDKHLAAQVFTDEWGESAVAIFTPRK